MKYYLIYFLIITAVNAFGQNLQDAYNDCVTNPPDFGKMPYDKAEQAVREDLRKKVCPEYIANVVTQLRHDGLEQNNKTLAFYLLGCLHPQETNAVEVLIENINFEATTFDSPNRFPRWGKYPAEEALVKIGVFVVGPVLDHLSVEAVPLRRQLMCDVLCKVESRQIAESQINRRLQSETNAVQQANFRMALKELDK